MSRVREYLKRFEQYKQWWRRNKAQVKKEEEAQNAIQRQINPDLLVQKIPSFDINTYKNFSDLATKLENIYDFIKHYGYSTENKEAKKEAESLKADTKHSRVLFNNENYTFVDTLSHKANCAWGINTKWCTTEKNSYMWDNYTNIGDLYILLDKKNNARYQFHVATGQYMDETDSPLLSKQLTDLFSGMPKELKMKIKEMANEGSKTIDTIQMVYDDVVNEKENLEKERDDMANDQYKLKNELKELEEKLEKMTEEYDEMDDDEKDDSNMDAEIQNLRDEIKEKESEVFDGQKDLERIDDEISNLEDGEFEYEGEMYDPDQIDFSKLKLRTFMNALNLSAEE